MLGKEGGFALMQYVCCSLYVSIAVVIHSLLTICNWAYDSLSNASNKNIFCVRYVRRLCMSMGPIKSYHLRVVASKCIYIEYTLFAPVVFLLSFFLSVSSVLRLFFSVAEFTLIERSILKAKTISLRCSHALGNNTWHKYTRDALLLPTYI